MHGHWSGKPQFQVGDLQSCTAGCARDHCCGGLRLHCLGSAQRWRPAWVDDDAVLAVLEQEEEFASLGHCIAACSGTAGERSSGGDIAAEEMRITSAGMVAFCEAANPTMGAADSIKKVHSSMPAPPALFGMILPHVHSYALCTAAICSPFTTFHVCGT